MKDSLFIVIEGLDGSGKSTVAKVLLNYFNEHFPDQVKYSFEPHNQYCGGQFIRDILEKRITQFVPEVLALSLAANRLDHCTRLINPWLDEAEGRMILCDRYYLSSLVYQRSDIYTFERIMELNQHARRPDLIFFLDVSNEVCYERMDRRNQPRELFEGNLDETRNKYREAIDFLQSFEQTPIVDINANGTVEMVAQQMLDAIAHRFPSWGA